MIYKSYNDLSRTLRRNLWKIPADVGLVVGVPRSGMIPALMLSELMNIPCADLYSFAQGRVLPCGERRRLMRGDGVRRVLVLDDTVFAGKALGRARDVLHPLQGQYSILYGCVYAEGRHARRIADIWLEDIYVPEEGLYLYEWNILHHYEKNTLRMMWDIDGILCQDPPDERDAAAYEAYLPEAVEMVVPTTRVGAFVTYRLEKYRGVTEQWLRRRGITYDRLEMFPAETPEQRKAMESPASYKARHYREARWAVLFLESDASQAEQICRLAGKPVWCYSTGRMYLCP